MIFLENKYLYRRIKEMVSDQVEPLPLGAARVVRNGRDATVVTYGAMVHETVHAADRLRAEQGYEVKVLDLRTLKPLDEESIRYRMKKSVDRLFSAIGEDGTGGKK